MAKFYVGKGIDEYISQLGIIDESTDEVIGQAIHEGAKVVADAVRSELAGVPTSGTFDETQKQGLLDGLGIASKRTDGTFVNVKVGFDGYNQKKTKTYPNGQPNAMIARAVNSGTSFSKKNPFVDRAVRKTKDSAEQAMKAEVDKALSKIGG